MESSPVTARGSVAVWEAWEAKETMVMSMSSLETPLEADPVILMLLLRCVPALQGSILTWTPSNVDRGSQLPVSPVRVFKTRDVSP
jgi:hypothetical protein